MTIQFKYKASRLKSFPILGRDMFKALPINGVINEAMQVDINTEVFV